MQFGDIYLHYILTRDQETGVVLISFTENSKKIKVVDKHEVSKDFMNKLIDSTDISEIKEAILNTFKSDENNNLEITIENCNIKVPEFVKANF